MAPSPPGLPSTPGVITASAEERRAGKWSRANLQRALELFHRDGLIVMGNIVDPKELLQLKENMLATSSKIQESKTDPTQFNHGIKSNFLQAPPMSTPELLFPDVYQNPFIIQICEGYLGSGLCMPFITANTAIANTAQKQPIHKDCSFLHPMAPFMAISNFLLDDFKPENGSTEFWLGSHQQTSPSEQFWRTPESIVPTCDIIPEFLEERRATRPPSQVTVPFGSCLLRDPRTWHAGMPNPSDNDRIMVAVAYQSNWFTRDRRFKAPESARALLTGNPKVTPLCEFLPDEEWDKICQNWGQGEEMDLTYSPFSEGWVTIGDLEPEQKVINPEFNPAAKGSKPGFPHHISARAHLFSTPTTTTNMSFGQIAFLPLVEKAPESSAQPLLSALARITPFLVASSAFEATRPSLPSSAEYFILQDEELSADKVFALLDGGAHKLVTKDLALLGQIPADRLVLHLDPSTATCLADAKVLAGISGVLLETPTVAENLLKSFRTALSLGEGRPRDLFILSATRDEDAVLHQPAALKLMSKTVNGTSVIPISFLSTTLGNFSSPQPENNKLSVATLFTSALRTDRPDGLYPTIPVSLTSVPSTLGLVYSSGASIANSIISGNAVYYSRSRNGLWKKGETSGAMQMVERIRMDCDADALEFGVVETGPNGEKEGFCHVPEQVSCFGGVAGLGELEATLKARFKEAPKGSYTARLFSEPALLKAKIMEEAGELCEAQSKEDIAAEAADLFYFALAKCVSAGVGLKDVGKVLDKRSLKVTRRKGDAKKEWVEKLGLKEEQAVGIAGGVGPSKEEVSKAVPVPKEEATPAPVAEDLRCQTFDLSNTDAAGRDALLKRPLASSADMFSLVAPILSTVRTGGDAGLRSLIVKFDRCAPAEDTSFPLVLKAPFAPESMVLEPSVKAAIDQAYLNIKAFHQAQMDKEAGTLVVETMPGVVCSRFARPIERVGLYVPGGTAILPSTALMLAVPAQVAQCSLAVLATPPRPDGSISPEIVYIASLTGVDSIVRAGGAHAVAAMAYGTESVSKVDKIFGPGNQFVTAAKMSVSMDSEACCAIDMPAGPSEVLVIADASSDPAFVASDLLSQAEHGADSQVILLAVALNDTQLSAIEAEIKKQALALPRVDIIRKSIAHSLIIKCRDLDEAMTFSNSYAPEHLILQLENASSVVPSVRNAGSVFVGAYSPESCGDYASGTNHTLPTAGWAKQYSGVSTLSFLKHITAQELSREGLLKLGPVVETLAAAEGLDAHKMAVTVRLATLRK